jgi:prepilin-type N-terminal cleavage/methylation domain-containing protein
MHRPRTRDHGFTLIEILVAIVVVGILAAVVVVGVSALTNKGSSAACTASLDAAKAASLAHYTNAAAFPATFTDMTGASPSELNLPSSATIDATGLIVSTSGWSLTLTPGAAGTAPTFTCATGGSGAAAATTTAAATATTVASNGTAACPGSFSGWVGEYYSNQSLSGSPNFCNDDPAISFNWGGGSPRSGFPSDHFSIRWTKTVNFSNGNHVFTMGSDDGSRLYVDGTKVLDMWRDQSYATSTVTQSLSGPHTVTMEFYENGGLANATLSWT